MNPKDGGRVSCPTLGYEVNNGQGRILNAQALATQEHSLPPRTWIQTHFSNQEETIHVVRGWSLTCLCWLWNSFSVIMKPSLKRGFSAHVNSWNMISICSLHSILDFCSFLNVCIHLNSLKWQPWKWISKKLSSVYMP